MVRQRLFLAAAACALAAPSLAQLRDASYRTAEYAVHSGTHDGAANTAALAFEEVVHFPEAVWLRVEFAAAELGEASWVELFSLDTGTSQTLRAGSMKEWYLGSAMLAGKTLVVRLHVAPGDRGVFFETRHVLVGLRPRAPSVDSLCGDDDRVVSLDNRVRSTSDLPGLCSSGASASKTTARGAAVPGAGAALGAVAGRAVGILGGGCPASVRRAHLAPASTPMLRATPG